MIPLLRRPHNGTATTIAHPAHILARILPLPLYRRLYPPRSVLDLVDDDELPRSLVIQRANSISMFQAVRYWAISSPSTMSPLGPFQAISGPVTRAKLASGVPLLMNAVGSDWMIHRQRLRQARLQASGRMPLLTLQRFKRLLFGN